MTRRISRGAFTNLVAQVASVAAEARASRQQREAGAEKERAVREAQAEFKRQNEPTPLEAAVAKAKEDVRLAKEKDAFVVKAQNDVFISGDVLRKNKDEAAKAIRKKSSGEMMADMQRQERKENE